MNEAIKKGMEFLRKMELAAEVVKREKETHYKANQMDNFLRQSKV